MSHQTYCATGSYVGIKSFQRKTTHSKHPFRDRIPTKTVSDDSNMPVPEYEYNHKGVAAGVSDI